MGLLINIGLIVVGLFLVFTKYRQLRNKEFKGKYGVVKGNAAIVFSISYIVLGLFLIFTGAYFFITGA